MALMHILEREIILDTDPETLWEFLATPANLNELTPSGLHFQILSEVPAKMYNGLLILYEIQIPIFGKRRWLTEIKHIENGAFFVDEQRFGPYKLWYHQHRIEPFEDKTKMLDRVCYQLPFGIVGRLVHRFWVKDALEEIFNYRTERLTQMFGE
jgi:ligand-binding SRPBCC domain-containing protein